MLLPYSPEYFFLVKIRLLKYRVHPRRREKTDPLDCGEGLVDSAKHLLVAIPLRLRRVDEVRVELVPCARDRYQTMSTAAPFDLVHVVNLAALGLALGRTHPVRGSDQVLQVNVGEREIVEHDFDGSQSAEPGEESQVFLLGSFLGVVELAVGAVGAFFYLRDESFLPPFGNFVGVLRGVFLGGVAAVAAVAGGAGGGAVVEVEGGSLGESEWGRDRRGQDQGGGGGGGEGRRKRFAVDGNGVWGFGERFGGV